MTDEQMRAECAAIQAEWQMGGLTGGLYEDFAVELAKRVQAAERERCAKICESRMTRSQSGHPYPEGWDAACLINAADIRGPNVEVSR